MKFLPLIWAGLWRKPVRTALTTLSLIAAFMLFGLLRSVDAGFDRLIANGMEDRLFVSPQFFNAPLPLAYGDQIARMDGVTKVGYQAFINGYYRDPKTYFFIGGGSTNVFELYPEFDIDKSTIEALHAKANGVAISPGMAKHLGGVKIGDHVVLHSDIKQANGSSDWDVEVVGFVERRDSPGLFAFSFGNFGYINEARADQKNTVQQYQVLIADPKRGLETAHAIDAMFLNSGTPTRTTVDALNWKSGLSGFGDAKLIINGILAGVLVVLLLLTATTLAQSVDERRGEFAVMKTLGYSDRAILCTIFAEALLQCLLAAAVGLALSAVLSPLLQNGIPGPTILFHVPASVVATGVAAAVLVAAVAAAVPGVRASRMQIVDALAKR